MALQCDYVVCPQGSNDPPKPEYFGHPLRSISYLTVTIVLLHAGLSKCETLEGFLHFQKGSYGKNIWLLKLWPIAYLATVEVSRPGS